MDPRTPSPTASDTHYHQLPPLPNAKLRLMCSYGGHIAPRPLDKSLCYVGGESRIVALDRHSTAASLSALSANLSRSLYNNRPFTLKYQLPNEDLDSLISVTTDEDLQNMIEEHDHIASSHAPSRIRLFLFPSKPDSVGSGLLDPKSESWFCDALKGTRIMQRGQSAESGMGNGFMGLDCAGPADSSVEAQFEGLNYTGESKPGFDFGSVPESMVLETSSSFGSSSSSTSMSNLPPIGVHGEDVGVNLQDKKVKVASPGSIESDNSVPSNVSHPKTGIYQDQVVHVPSLDTKVPSNTVESESIIFDPSYMIQMQKTIQASGYPFSHLTEQKQLQQEVQYIHTAPHYIPQYPTNPLPISSYYPMYHPQLHQPSQPYPIYLVPIRPTQPYNISVPHNSNDSATVAPNRPLLPPHTAIINPQVANKDKPLDSVLSNQNHQQFVGPSEMQTPCQSMAPAAMATASCGNEFDDDLAYAQIYKSQPSAPALTTQYQTMTKAATVLLSEAPTKMDTNNIMQQVGSLQP